MVEKLKGLASGVQTFEQIIKKGSVYVDKTAFIDKMLSNDNKVWFLSRPRRFGKSLTVTTFDALFSGKKALFKGLYIASQLKKARFAPRPVIRLDMTLPTLSEGVKVFKKSLGLETIILAKKLGVKVDPTLQPGEMLRILIMEAAEKANRPCAILIDEYDAPFVAFMERPSKERKQLRAAMRDYYSKLKALDEYISFVFVTGITKSAHLGLLSIFNSYNDISINPEYGAICGFTQEELQNYFAPHIKRTAERLKMTETELLEKTRDYYNGFSFDGVTRVYNPFSTLLFFQNQEFQQFWFETGTSTLLANFMKNNRLTVEEFSGMMVPKKFAKDPGAFKESNPVSFLYQTGYLSLRPGSTEDNFTLDYPNLEVRESMDNLLVINFLGLDKATKAYNKLQNALVSRDAPEVIKLFNKVLAKIPYADYTAARVKTDSKSNVEEVDYGEFLYRASLLSFIHGAGARVFPETQGNLGRTDLVVDYKNCTWVLEIKVCQSVDKEKETLENARAQMIAQGYSEPYDHPICLGIVINDQLRKITLWEDFGNLEAKTKARQNNPPTEKP
ncbi:MAG: ATP-binding protein [Deltaproteobacteria bacterium]|jgi:hypothetical protein|nr:ATP-binding protein [Deltaproteobacteria bacterium]